MIHADTTSSTSTDNAAPANTARFDAEAIIAKDRAAIEAALARLKAFEPTIALCCHIAETSPVPIRDVCYAAVNNAVWIYLRVTSIDQVVQARRHMAAHGMHLNDDGVRDYPDNSRQTHGLSHGDFRIIVDFTFPTRVEPNQTCAYVQTGTKTVPTYELRCSEGAPT